MKMRFLGHGTFDFVSEAGHKVLIDPFLDNNPQAALKSDAVSPDFIILTHAHEDHFGDAIKIGKRCDPLFICMVELAKYLAEEGFKTHQIQIGGSHPFPFGRVKLTPAWHSSTTPDGRYGGQAAGVLLWIDGKCVYHPGDTGLFYDMKLIGEMNRVDYFLVPIGDNFTVGPEDALKAVEFVNPGMVIPMHYNTWPVINADPEDFTAKVQAMGYKCQILKPGEELQT